ncbi:MAG: methionyl-tRNA synthetase, partial [Thermoleophilia bacterium]|nr:methionyl-tRNA synthetase [Thermoleophilia bacterium]
MSYYVTTPIYYVNSTPHLGHAYTTIAADVITRFQRLIGNESFFLTGTDEHGSKIAEAAAEAGEQPQAFTDRISQRFRDLLPLLDAKNDFFIRTTDEPHKAYVQRVASKMHEQGDIYEASYSGPYCTGCERYYKADELLEGTLCPIHKRPVEHLEETNWFFRLSAYKERLLEYYRANPEWIQPRSKYNEAIALIDQLEDLSISRNSIDWGVDVPWDDSQVFYVWIDALFNYASALTYARGEDLTDQFWPPAVQIIAKDILKFHAVYWPAFLMSAGLELPELLYIHGYLTVGGEKMGKSMGNALDPFPLIEQLGPDPLRFYLLREVQFGADGAVSQEGFERRYDGELANDLGNLVSRTAAMLVKYRGDADGVAAVPSVPSSVDVALKANVMVEQWKTQMSALELSPALETIWAFVRDLNRLVEDRAPWKLAKDETQSALLDGTIGVLVEGLIAVCYGLSPVMPGSSEKIDSSFAM